MESRRLRTRLARTSALFALASLACGAEPDPPCTGVECATHRFFGVEPEPVPDCPGRAYWQLDLQLDVELVFDSALAEGDVSPLTRAIARYYADYGISFRLLEPPRQVDLAPLIAGSRADLDRAFAEAGLPSGGDVDPEQAALAQGITAEILFTPMREFLQAHALPPRPLVSLVVLEPLVAPSLYEEGLLSGELNGLGFSPELFQQLRASGEATDLFEALALPAEFTPTVLLDFPSLARLDSPDNVVAHEVGHAYGLTHTDEPGNLMNVEVAESCRAWLSDEQAAALAAVVAAR